MSKQTEILNGKINRIETILEEQNKKIIQLESTIMKLNHPPKFKLGDCVKIPTNTLPNKIIGMEWKQESMRPFHDSPLTHYYEWVYTCINKNYAQTQHKEYTLHLSKEKIKEE